jgi:predicted membrane-bound spermidine synthase
MSFKLFIYYCALCGAWAAFLAWGLVQGLGVGAVDSAFLRVILIGGILGALVAGAVGLMDAILNAKGSQRFVRVALCMVLGGLGGMFGGLIGQVLYETISHLLLFIGWIIAGGLIGASVGAFDLLRAVAMKQDLRMPLRKALNGVYGGFLGGLIGGLVFGVVSGIEFLPRSGLALGLVILGLCIGLLIGLAQVFLKEAWLKVESGFRAGREVMLSKDETTIGRAESCDVGLFGDNAVERTHARILQKDNRYVLADAETPGGTFLNGKPIRKPTPLRDGDSIGVGNSVLRFGERQKRS